MEKNTETGLALSQERSLATVDVAQTRAAQEVQAAMVVAKKFPRDQIAAERRIIEACKRPALAKAAAYEYQRGGGTISGPSIRLAEVLSQNWGNIDSGIVELEQRNGESQVMAYAWDLETNTRSTKVFTVRHERRVGRGEDFQVKTLTDPRDVYEMVANNGARRLRACILAVIPGDIVESAMDACDKTMLGENKAPLKERVKSMLELFAPFRVTQAMIEDRIGHSMASITERELLALGKVYTGIKDNFMSVAECFTSESTVAATTAGGTRAEQVAAKLRAEGVNAPPPTEEPPHDPLGGDGTKPADGTVIITGGAAPAATNGCAACSGTGKNSKGAACPICNGSGKGLGAPPAITDPERLAKAEARRKAKADAAKATTTAANPPQAPTESPKPAQSPVTATEPTGEAGMVVEPAGTDEGTERRAAIIEALEDVEYKHGRFIKACTVGQVAWQKWRLAATAQLEVVLREMVPESPVLKPQE